MINRNTIISCIIYIITVIILSIFGYMYNVPEINSECAKLICYYTVMLLYFEFADNYPSIKGD